MVRFALAVLGAVVLALLVVAVASAQGIVPTWPGVLLQACQPVGGTYNNNFQCNASGTVSTAYASQYVNETVHVTINANANITSSSPLFISVTNASSTGSISTCNITAPDSGDYACHYLGSSVGYLHQIVVAASANNQVFGLGISIVPDAVQPTPTPVNTPLPGTPYPTNTPILVTGGTFTRTPTPALPTLTPTPFVARDCGDATFPLLNCDGAPGHPFSGYPLPPAGPLADAVHWNSFASGTTGRWGPCSAMDVGCLAGNTNNDLIDGAVYQDVTAAASGNLYVYFNAATNLALGSCYAFGIAGYEATHCNNSGPVTLLIGPVVAGTSYQFYVCSANSGGGGCGSPSSQYFNNDELYIYNVWVGTSNTPTATVATNTPTPGGPTSTSTRTVTGTPTTTPLPWSTPTVVASATPCPGGCAVTQLSPLPEILGTAIIIPTGPFSYLTGLSLGRSPCSKFGDVPVLVPYVTPVGALTPLSYVWGPPTPVALSTTVISTGPISGTAIIPCADPQIPSYVWDVTWYGSIMLIFMCFIGWLVWFVHRLVNNQGTAG